MLLRRTDVGSMCFSVTCDCNGAFEVVVVVMVAVLAAGVWWCVWACACTLVVGSRGNE